MVEPRLEEVFPRLRARSYQVTSPRDERYNCIAWALGDTDSWWWPDETSQDRWHPGVARVERLEAFVATFATSGYERCDDERLETGYEKIALFARDNLPKHAARQLPNGRWSSKLGVMEDIEHDLRDLEGHLYGAFVMVLRRSVSRLDPSTS